MHTQMEAFWQVMMNFHTVVKNFQIWRKFPRSRQKVFTFVKYFPRLHNCLHAYSDIYIPIKSILMGDGEFSHGCQKFPPSGQKISTFVKYFPCLHNTLHSYKSICILRWKHLMDKYRFSHGNQKFPHSKNFSNI